MGNKNGKTWHVIIEILKILLHQYEKKYNIGILLWLNFLGNLFTKGAFIIYKIGIRELLLWY